jgi:solute carrier family 25 carnitine/acylcarnitine transporter 20/29
MQAQMLAPKAATASSTGSATTRVTPKFTGSINAATTIFRERGFAGITQGLQATIARNIVGVCAYFYVYEAMRQWLANGKHVSTLSNGQVRAI